MSEVKIQHIKINTDRITPSTSGNSKAEAEADSEATFLEQEQIRTIAVKKSEAEYNRYVSEHEVRLNLINILLAISVIWMFFILIIIIACGKKNLELSDGVLIALITTSTTELLGFFYIVLKYLFNDSKST